MRMSGDCVFWASTALLMVLSCALAQQPSNSSTEKPPAITNGTIATTVIATTKISTSAAPTTTATTIKPTTAKATTKASPAPMPANATTAVPVSPATNASSTTISKTVTTAASTASTPVTSSESSAPQKISGFDLGSFIGGIVLTLGLLAVLYFGCKFYNSKRGVRYRTIDEHEAII